MPSFPFIVAFVRHGRLVAVAVSAVLLLLGLYGAWRLAAPDLAVIGLIIAAGGYLGVRLLVEIVQAIAETLLPR